MTVAELLKRARAQIGLITESKRELEMEHPESDRAIYQLGAGVIHPSARHPWGDTETGACDCSSYVCWCLGINKFDPDFDWLRTLNGAWFNTGGIWWDASMESTGRFERLSGPIPGAVVVYPSSSLSTAVRRRSPALDELAGDVLRCPPVGHVGIVTVVSGSEPRAVIHCSSGNYRRTGDAIQETGPEVFTRVPATIYAWCSSIERPASEAA